MGKNSASLSSDTAISGGTGFVLRTDDENHRPAAVARKTWVSGLLLLALCDLGLHLLYFVVPDEWLRSGLHLNGLVRPSAAIIAWLDPQTLASAQPGGVVGTAAGSVIEMRIVRGCDGAGVLFLLVSAVVALRGPLRWVASGVALAALWSYGLNLARIVGLYFVLAYRPALFDQLHSLVLPLAVILLSGLFALAWAEILGGHSARGKSAELPMNAGSSVAQ